MAIKLLDKPNVESVSYDYPYGNIKDNPGDNTGTPVNKLVYADFHQFFAKLMDDAGISYNGLPDNATDGFQYWLALVEAVKNNCAFYDDISASVTVNGSLTVGNKTIRHWKDGTVEVILDFTYSGDFNSVANVLTGLPTPSAVIVPVFAYLINGSSSAHASVQCVLNLVGQLKNIDIFSSTYGSGYIYFTYKKV